MRAVLPARLPQSNDPTLPTPLHKAVWRKRATSSYARMRSPRSNKSWLPLPPRKRGAKPLPLRRLRRHQRAKPLRSSLSRSHRRLMRLPCNDRTLPIPGSTLSALRRHVLANSLKTSNAVVVVPVAPDRPLIRTQECSHFFDRSAKPISCCPRLVRVTNYLQATA
jgi:hypothetical protein